MKQLFKGKKVTILGLGLHGGGVGVAKCFCNQGADVLVTDLKTKEQLEESIKNLKNSNM
jgi:UDP-N-acetylmuramoylalanine--D-glutamate ligase